MENDINESKELSKESKKKMIEECNGMIMELRETLELTDEIKIRYKSNNNMKLEENKSVI